MNSNLMTIFSVMVLAIFLAAAPPASAGQDDVSLIETDFDKIKRLHHRWTDALNAGDVETAATLLTGDSVFLPPGQDTIEGRDQIVAWLEQLAVMLEGVTFTESRLTIDEILVHGDMAFSRSTFNATMAPKAGGDGFSTETRTLLIWQRGVDGTWKIARDMWNSSGPQT